MIRFLADENLNNQIIRGLVLRIPDLDIVRVQDMGLSGIDDITILEICFQQNRILLTHDLATIPRFAYERIRHNLPIPGIFIINQDIPVGRIVSDLEIVVKCSVAEEWEGKIFYLPL